MNNLAWKHRNLEDKIYERPLPKNGTLNTDFDSPLPMNGTLIIDFDSPLPMNGTLIIDFDSPLSINGTLIIDFDSPLSMNGTRIIGGDVSADWQRFTLLQVKTKMNVQNMRPFAFWTIIITGSGSVWYLMGTKPLAWSLHADTKMGQKASEWSPPSPEKIFDVGTFKMDTDTTAIGRRRTNYIDITESQITGK